MPAVSKKSITPAQIRLIKVLQRRLGLSEEDYRALLWEVAKVRSCRELAGPAIELVIQHLSSRAQAWGQGAGTGGQGPTAERMATPRQLAKIESLWQQVSRAPADRRDRALRQFLQNRFNVASPRWLTAATAEKVIEGLKKMAGRS